jgi:dipeptide transport system ATP-binding protein
VSRTIITGRGLGKSYDVKRGMFGATAELKAVADASFTVEEGRTLAIVGESGSGKSTLARLITMIEPPTAGSLVIDGIDVGQATAEERRKLRRMVQIVFQNPYGSLNPRQQIGTILEEPLVINTTMPAAARRDRSHEMLAAVGLRPEHYQRYPHMFSGGQRQRIAIARALMLEPKILVLDEPVSALDLSIQAQILNLLADLQERLGLTYVFISHALSVVRHVATDVMVMYLGRVVEVGPVAALFKDPQHPYTQALLAATPIADPSLKRARIRLEGELPSPINPPPGCAFNPRCRFASDRCRRERPELLGAMGTATACFAVEERRIGGRNASAPAA